MNAGRSVAVLLWIAFAVLVAAVLWIVLAACGLAWPGGRPMLVFCPVDAAAREVDPTIAAEQERQRALQGRVRDLEIALLARPYCAAQEPGPEPEPPSLEDAIRQGDEQALAGCWELASDYMMEEVSTGEPMPVQDWEICFADDGRGSQTMVFTSGLRCHGRANADFPDDSTLQIDDAGNMTCPGWGELLARTTTCKLGGDGTAQCVSRDLARPDEGVATVTIRRKH
ncbi:MAG: hypothetical protein ACREJ0_10270 [Geminicoccaceae bacterium]